MVLPERLNTPALGFVVGEILKYLTVVNFIKNGS
jgi:hypothetical protein